MRCVFFLLLLSLSANAQRFRLTGEVKSIKEGSWIYLSYWVQEKRVVDSTQVKAGRFRFSNKLKYPVPASLCERSDELYDGDNRFSFILEPAKFVIYSAKQLGESSVKNSQLNADNNELIRRMITHSLSRKNVMQEYSEWLKTGEKDITLLKKAKERQKEESISTDSVCIEFAKEHPNSYASAQVLAKIMAGYEANTPIYERAKQVFDRCPRRWKKAPMIMALTQKKLSRPRFFWKDE